MPAGHFGEPKKAPSVPVGDWSRGPMTGWTKDLLAEPRLQHEGYFDPRAGPQEVE